MRRRCEAAVTNFVKGSLGPLSQVCRQNLPEFREVKHRSPKKQKAELEGEPSWGLRRQECCWDSDRKEA